MPHTLLTPLSRHLGRFLALWLVFLSFAFGQSPETLSNSERSPQIEAFVEERYLQANEFMRAHKGEEALAAINEAIRFDPDCGKCFGLRSGIYGDLQKYREGVADGFQGVRISKTPRHKAMAAYNKGFNLGGLDRNSEALEAYNDSIAFDSTYEMAHFGKGKQLYFLGMWSESVAALEKALSLNPNHGAAWAYLAEDQVYLRDAKAGMTSANKAVELAPSDPRSFRARTIAHMAQQNFEPMLADAKRALELDPSRPQAHLLLGNALNFLGRYKEAAEEFAREPDREAVEARINPSPQIDLRIYNCGDTSTEIQTPSNYNVDGLNDCVGRFIEYLREMQQAATPSSAKSKIPGLPAKNPAKK